MVMTANPIPISSGETGTGTTAPSGAGPLRESRRARPLPAVQKAARHSAQARWTACTEQHAVMAAHVRRDDAGQQPAL